MDRGSTPLASTKTQGVVPNDATPLFFYIYSLLSRQLKTKELIIENSEYNYNTSENEVFFLYKKYLHLVAFVI